MTYLNGIIANKCFRQAIRLFSPAAIYFLALLLSDKINLLNLPQVFTRKGKRKYYRHSEVD